MLGEKRAIASALLRSSKEIGRAFFWKPEFVNKLLADRLYLDQLGRSESLRTEAGLVHRFAPGVEEQETFEAPETLQNPFLLFAGPADLGNGEIVATTGRFRKLSVKSRRSWEWDDWPLPAGTGHCSGGAYQNARCNTQAAQYNSELHID